MNEKEPVWFLNFYEYSGRRVLYDESPTIFVVILVYVEGNGVEEGSEVGVLPVESGREGEFAVIHV